MCECILLKPILLRTFREVPIPNQKLDVHWTLKTYNSPENVRPFAFSGATRHKLGIDLRFLLSHSDDIARGCSQSNGYAPVICCHGKVQQVYQRFKLSKMSDSSSKPPFILKWHIHLSKLNIDVSGEFGAITIGWKILSKKIFQHGGTYSCNDQILWFTQKGKGTYPCDHVDE